jgi:hypothetical protein
MSLYEGTNGIQSMDLMGRKMRMREGACLEGLSEGNQRFLQRQPGASRTGAQC